MLVAPLLFALEIRGAVDCPAPAEVQHELRPLLGAEVTARDVAVIMPGTDGSIALSLNDAAGQPIGARTLPRARSCDEQAKAVAVTLAVWEAQLHPEISLGLDRLAPAEPVALRPPLKPAAAPELEVAARAAPVPPAPSAPSSMEAALGLAALGDWQSGAWAPGARLELSLGPAGGRWRARAGATWVGRHRLDLPPGTVSWWRAFVQVGADVDVASGERWGAAVGAGALAGVVSVAGEGFPVDRKTRSIDLGGEVRARGEGRLGPAGRVRPWVGVSLAVWGRRQGLDIEGISTRSALPRVEPLGGGGRRFRVVM